uniref:Reverse transcriptase zinc-binding domain-containing protein n=1 Tax=Lactuca sativa TaxID=4236 RepID=A0A9R1XPG8_LACSA|nr:hypothetical protein LSAT_V11C200093890 [Lactuca sativa]
MEEDQRCIHWVKWDIILKSRDKGGLEVGSLDAFNRDLLFKWKWRFLHDHSTLWLRLIKGLHGDFGDLANNFGLLEVWEMGWPRISGIIVGGTSLGGVALEEELKLRN